MPGRAPSFVIPRRLHPGWSLLGRLLRRVTGDRLRAEALHLLVLTAGALAWLMAAYAAAALAEAFAPRPFVLWGSLAGAGVLFVLLGLVGVRPRAVVTCGESALRVERGREQVQLSYAALAAPPQTVAPRLYHRHYRRYAAVHPFLNTSGGAVLLLRTQAGPAVALGLDADQQRALSACVEKRTPPTAQEERPLSETASKTAS